MGAAFGAIAAASLVLGWQAHKWYLRKLYKTMHRIRRQLRGGLGR